MKKRISVLEEHAGILAKTASLLEQGQSVTLVPSDDKSRVDIFYAYSNQLVLFAPPALGVEKARHQCFETGDRVALARNREVWLQFIVKRVEDKQSIVCCPIDKCGKVDWSKEFVWKPEQIVIIQAFKDYLLHGLDLSTISEEWAAIESAKKLIKLLTKQLQSTEDFLRKARVNNAP